MKIVADSDLPFVADYFGDFGELTLKPGRLLQRADLIDADLLLVRSVTPVNEKLLQDTAVKFVGTVTTGIDHLDTAWLAQAGIQWCAASGYNASPVADYVIAVVAALQRQKRLALTPLRVGVVGVGQVGSRVAARFEALGFEVFLCDPLRAEKERNFQSLPLSALPPLDLLSLHTPLTKDGNYPTEHLIDAAFLQAAENSILLNTSRGAVVNTAVLENFNRQWTYCFDVWEGEPELNLDLLQSSLIATPHLAGYSVQCRYRGIRMIYDAACAAGVLKAQVKPLPALPTQTLSFGNQKKSWQEVVLAIFDPFMVTQVMKETLAKEKVLLKGSGKCATLFDDLREQYIGNNIMRHEFAYLTLADLRLDERDREILIHLGMTIKE